MPVNEKFYTLRGYGEMNKSGVSTAMEDYLEMICRIVEKDGYARVNHLAALLNVTSPSASKMVNRLKKRGMVEFEPYGIVRLTDLGREYGAYLLRRHDVLHRFFCMLNRSENELELVEKIEHFIDERTVKNMEGMLGEGDNREDDGGAASIPPLRGQIP